MVHASAESGYTVLRQIGNIYRTARDAGPHPALVTEGLRARPPYSVERALVFDIRGKKVRTSGAKFDDRDRANVRRLVNTGILAAESRSLS
jgi:hypothetical protein